MLCSLVTRLDGVLVLSILIFVSTEIFAQKCANDQGKNFLSTINLRETCCITLTSYILPYG